MDNLTQAVQIFHHEMLHNVFIYYVLNFNSKSSYLPGMVGINCHKAISPPLHTIMQKIMYVYSVEKIITRVYQSVNLLK